jgi:hypothetical protein
MASQDSNSQELKKLLIESYSDKGYNTLKEKFSVQYNPEKYSQKYEVTYRKAQGKGTSASAQVYGTIKPQDYSFDLVFDGTGVSGETIEVADKIEEFLKITGKYQGKEHRPRYLKLIWGGLTVKSVLKTADITYDYFKPSGHPLRAKVKAVFSENINDTLRAAKENSSSPDLTHRRIVADGDNLPLMCQDIYGDFKYYYHVAEINGITDFRKLKTGQEIFFPPLKTVDADDD